MSAAETTSGEDDSVPPATSESTETIRNGEEVVVRRTVPRYDGTPMTTVSAYGAGFGHLAKEPDSESPTSPPSDERSRGSTRPFRQPRNVREFAAQANRVATSILNGEIDLDTARAYSAVARTVAQAVTAQTVHARFLKTKPDLDFPEEDE